jgi:Response regulator containing a CheY-like receiver domain and an HTH DNA-binding domain
MPEQLILALQHQVPAFLEKWERGMALAGYLENTTAKREDCIRSYHGFLVPVWAHLERGPAVEDFATLLKNADGWADTLLQMARRHRLRGVTPEMFLGCFATLVQAVEDLLAEMDAPDARRLAALRIIRRYADAATTLLAGDAARLEGGESRALLDASNRQLTLEKNKFENIFACTSDLVLVTDAAGTITEANASALRLLGEMLLIGQPVWSVLGLEGATMREVLAYYPPSARHEVGIYDDIYYFELTIAPLKDVSLASTGYLFLLMNITAHVRHREILVQKVQERTAELETEKARLVEMNITLRNVISSIKRERGEFHEELARTVRQVFLPTLSRLRAENAPEVRTAYADLLGDQLLRLCSGEDADEDARLLRLSPMELKVCRFIQAGKRTKDISEALQLSVETVQTHRKNIRKKLNLKGGNANLFGYLRARGRTADTE